MWGDRQHPPHLAGAFDAIALTTWRTQPQPSSCSHAGPWFQPHQGALGGSGPDHLHGAVPQAWILQKLPRQS